MRNYKTTFSGILGGSASLIGGIVALIAANGDQYDPRITAIANIILAFGLIPLGVNAADAGRPKGR